ncbi:MAG: hypothetical protein IKA84_06000 [Clostridia bacterium]|nr:hypothetical protein [Clostridia bacterium]
MSYLLVFAVLLAIYIVGLLLLKYLVKHKTLVNVIFAIVIFASYFYVARYMYFDVGPNDWNFKNTLPTANVSPFMFCLTPLTLLMPRAIRKYLFTLIALLSLGMVVAGLGGALGFMVRDYKFHLHITMDCLAHVLISLWGVYLVKSGQVDLTPKKAIRGGSIIVCVAGTMLVLNLIFKTAFFGLSLYGEHNIYNNKIFESGIVSAFAYFFGLCLVLCAGYFYQKVFNLKRE